MRCAADMGLIQMNTCVLKLQEVEAMTNKPMLSVELRALLERLLSHDFAEECQECGIGYSDAWGDLRAILDKPAAIGSGDEDLVPFMRPALRDPVVGHCTHPPGCKSCSWCGFKEDELAPAIKLHLNVSNVKVTVNSDGSYTIDPADQPRLQGEPEELSTEELRFLDAVALNPGSKLNGGIACGEEGNSLWPRLEALGLIECLGSYKWQLTFSAFEMGVKAFLGMRPAQVVVEDIEAQAEKLFYTIYPDNKWWKADEDFKDRIREAARLNGVKT